MTISTRNDTALAMGEKFVCVLCVAVCMVGLCACGFPRPPDVGDDAGGGGGNDAGGAGSDGSVLDGGVIDGSFAAPTIATVVPDWAR